jgi:hypothetical protein
MKKARVEYRYDADVEALYPLLTGKDAIVDRFTGQGARDVKVLEHEDSGDTLRLVASYVLAIDVPGFAKRVLSPDSHITHTETWKRSADGSRAADFRVDVKGVPSSLTGTSSLVPDGKGARSITEAEIKVSVPLIGGKLEQMGVDRLHEDLAQVDVYLRSHVG